MSLACGGRGPCCHVGYAHRHCEHCDLVIPTSVAPPEWWQQHARPNYGSIGGHINGLMNSGYYNQSPLAALDAQFNQVDQPDK